MPSLLPVTADYKTIMTVTLPVAADYDVTGRTFPTGHMRVMPHTDMSALTLLFQRVGKPPSCFCDFVSTLYPALSVPGHDSPFPTPCEAPTPFTPPCTLLAPALHVSSLPTLPCSAMVLCAKV